jgi:hypothetical protein
MQNEWLTGRTRHDQRFCGVLFNKKLVLVLQVEVTWDEGPSDSNGMPEYLPGRGWRDATVIDLQRLNAAVTVLKAVK